jgi:hypothetical protein
MASGASSAKMTSCVERTHGRGTGQVSHGDGRALRLSWHDVGEAVGQARQAVIGPFEAYTGSSIQRTESAGPFDGPG